MAARASARYLTTRRELCPSRLAQDVVQPWSEVGDINVRSGRRWFSAQPRSARLPPRLGRPGRRPGPHGRRCPQVVLSSLGAGGHAGVRDTISSNVDALDDILTRLDAERHALADHTEVTVQAVELNRLKELSDHLGDTVNKVLGSILSGADRPAIAGTNSEAAASVRAAIRRINEVVRKMNRRDGQGMEGTTRG